MEVSTSRYMVLTVIHLHIIPHLFSKPWPTLTSKGPKQSVPVEKKAGLKRQSRAKGRSAILGTVGLALHL